MHLKPVPFSRFRTLIIVAALCILSGGIGYRFGQGSFGIGITRDNRVVVNQSAPSSTGVDFSLFWDVWQRLQKNYIDKSALNTQKMVYGAISGMVNSLDDPYTLFLPPTDNKGFKDDLGGQFEGIGAQLGLKDGHIMIVAPLKGMPAEKAGIKAGDFILKVDGADTTGWTVAQAVSKIRGQRGTSVKLQLFREKALKPFDVTITRDTITVSTVDSWIKKPSEITQIAGVSNFSALSAKPGKIAYISLSQFGDHTNDDWTAAVEQVAAAYKPGGEVKGLIFDLRNNPGGYLESAVYIGSEFIKSGTVVSQQNSDGTKEDYPTERPGKLLDIPVIVLINKGSASAAEIVSGALHDYKRATLVGETSFGKGSVQTPEDLPDGSGLHITTGKWLLPKGDWINKKGVTPDVTVVSDDTTGTADAQLAKAVELLLK